VSCPDNIFLAVGAVVGDVELPLEGAVVVALVGLGVVGAGLGAGVVTSGSGQKFPAALNVWPPGASIRLLAEPSAGLKVPGPGAVSVPAST